MARLHSRKKGKSGTKRAKSSVAPKWVSEKRAALREMIVKMSKEGVSAAKIGLHMRDQLGIANAREVLGNSIAHVLHEENSSPLYPDDLTSLIRKALRMRSHLKNLKKDVHNKVKLGHVESKIQRLAKYYVSKGILPKDWKYDPEQVALVVK